MTIDPPLFSIITVTKDNLRGLCTTHDSLKQSCMDYEWIVVDGGSKDGTKDYLAILPANWTSEPDNGIYDAMNKGLDRATGRYVVFMNAGDTFSDADILATLSKIISAENPDFIYGDALETGGFYKKARSHEQPDKGMFTHHQAMIYKREVIGSLRYDTHYKIAADYGFTTEFLKKAGAVHYCPAALCIFETGGVSQQRMTYARKEQFDIRKKTGLSFLQNAQVYAAQTSSAWIKKTMPALYKKLRS